MGPVSYFFLAPFVGVFLGECVASLLEFLISSFAVAGEIAQEEEEEEEEEEVPFLPPFSSKEESPVVDSDWQDLNEAEVLFVFVVVNGIIRIALK